MTRTSTKMSHAALGIPLPLLAVIALALAACGASPDAQSGGDEFRNVAQVMPMDEWVPGDLDRGEGDATDWKSVKLDDAGKLTVQFNTDKKAASATVELFDERGYAMGSAKHKAGTEAPVTLTAKAKRSGRYFIKIKHTGGEATAYSVQATMGAAASSDDGGLLPDL